MGIDRPDDDDIPEAAAKPGDADGGSVTPDEIGADEIGADEIGAGRERAPDDPGEPAAVGREFADDASRYDYHAEYRAKVDAVYQADARERWEQQKPRLEEEWRQYADDHPAPPDAHVDIDPDTCAQVERGCKEIRDTEEKIVTPAMSRIEAEDPARKLVGLEFRRKGQDRIMEKVARQMESQADLSADAALASVKDPIRYTFQYTEEHYTAGLNADVDRLKAAGFGLVELRNSWGREEYKGINSRWRVPDGPLFEVQFHTEISFEAKQLTHPAYERLRIQTTSKAERDELEAFQRRVSVFVPVPQGAPGYPNYP